MLLQAPKHRRQIEVGSAIDAVCTAKLGRAQKGPVMWRRASSPAVEPGVTPGGKGLLLEYGIGLGRIVKETRDTVSSGPTCRVVALFRAARPP